MLMKILLAGGTEGEQEFSSHTELDAYFEEPPQINIQPFEWWKVQEHKFPILAKLAKKYLPIPATSVPCEHSSQAGNIVNKKRSCLTPENVCKLVMLTENQEYL